MHLVLDLIYTLSPLYSEQCQFILTSNNRIRKTCDLCVFDHGMDVGTQGRHSRGTSSDSAYGAQWISSSPVGAMWAGLSIFKNC